MSEESESSERDGNPLAGVLDRLLNRERGGASTKAPAPTGIETPAEDAAPQDAPRPDERRMLPVAGLGADGGDAALRSAVQWTALLGKRPTVTDLCCGESPAVPGHDEEERVPPREDHVPRARMAWELERIRREPAQVVLALLERLRRHEQASSLSLVRIPARQRRALMRAAFLAGTLLVTVDDTEADFREALEISREVLENFIEVSVWPFSTSPACLERFLETFQGQGDTRVVPFDPGRLDLAETLTALRPPPREGFLIGLLAPEPAALPEGLLRLDSVEI